jgi:sugar phosphate isomerase/epimerase
MKRREFILSAVSAAAGRFLTGGSTALANAPSTNPHITWMQATRYLQWLTTPAYAVEHPRETGVKVGEAARQNGFGAVDLGVRRGAHIDPVHVAERLPLMLEGIRGTGIICEMITTDITDADAPVPGDISGVTAKADDIISVAAKLGIKKYRANPSSYMLSETGPFGDELKAQLRALGKRMKGLETLNQKYNVQACFHSYSGGRMISSVWDWLYAADGLDPNYIAMNFDIGHLFSEGASGSWRTNMRAAQPYWGDVYMKDVMFFLNSDANAPGRGGAARAAQPGRSAFVKTGTGLVPFKEFYQILLQGKYSGFAEPQDEYPLNGVSLNTTFWPDGLPPQITPEQMLENQRWELDYYKSQATAAGWTAAMQTPRVQAPSTGDVALFPESVQIISQCPPEK